MGEEIFIKSLAVINLIGLVIIALGDVHWLNNNLVKMQGEKYRFDGSRWSTIDDSMVKKKEKKLLKQLHLHRHYLIRANENYRSRFIVVIIAINMVLGGAYINLIGGYI